MNHVKPVDAAGFTTEVLGAKGPVVADFHATWCGPCKMLAPLLDGLAGEFAGRVRFVKVDIDEAPALASQYQITGVPTLIFFRDGQPVDQLVGVPSARALRTRIEALVAPQPAASDRAA